VRQLSEKRLVPFALAGSSESGLHNGQNSGEK